jgi:hypothetical protein
MANTENTRESLCAKLRAAGIDPETRSGEIDRFIDSDERCRELRKRETEGSEVGLTRAITAALNERRQCEKALLADGPAEGRPRQTEMEKRAYVAGIAYTRALCGQSGQAWLVFFRDNHGKRSGPEYLELLAEHGEPTAFIDFFPNAQEFILGGPCNPSGKGPEDEEGRPKYWEATS